MDIDPLLRRVVADDRAAWSELVGRIVAQIEAIARSHKDMRRRGLGVLPDDISDVRTDVLSRLERNGYENLRRYLSQAALPRAQSFDSWLYGAVDYVIREHLRKRYGRAPKPSAATDGSTYRPSKRGLNTLAEPLDGQALDLSLLRAAGVTTALSMAEIFHYIDEHFSEPEKRALLMHYGQDRSLAEIAEALALADESEAHKLIRRLTARLRHRFSESGRT